MKQTMEMSSGELRELMGRRGVTAEAMADAVHQELRHVYRWLGDEQPPMPRHLQALLRDRFAASQRGPGGG